MKNIEYQFFFPPSFPAFFSLNTNSTSIEKPICPISEVRDYPKVHNKRNSDGVRGIPKRI